MRLDPKDPEDAERRWLDYQLDMVVDPSEASDQHVQAESLQSSPFQVGHARLVSSDRPGGNRLRILPYSTDQGITKLLF